jgi:hypothetical protein
VQDRQATLLVSEPNVEHPARLGGPFATTVPSRVEFVMNGTATAVAFTTADPFAADDDNCAQDVYVADLLLGSFPSLTNITRITNATNVCATGGSPNSDFFSLAMNNSGRYVAYSTGLQEGVTGDTNIFSDVHLYDRQTGTKELISARHNTTTTSAATGAALRPAISDDGNLVSFTSNYSDLVAGDTNGVGDVFVRNRAAQATLRVSQTPAGTQGNLPSDYGVISGDGRFVAFSSASNTLVPNDANNRTDVFIACTGVGACP